MNQSTDFRNQSRGFRDQGPGSRNQSPGFRNQGPGSRNQGPGFRNQGHTAWGKGEDHTLWRHALALAECAVLPEQPDHGLRVVNGLGDEPLHTEFGLLHQRLMLVALLDVPLGDGDSAVCASGTSVELGGDSGDGGAAVLIRRGRTAHQVVRVHPVLVDGRV